MYEVIYPKVYDRYVLTKEGNLYDLDAGREPQLIDKDVKDFISEWSTIIYLTKLGDVKVKNNEVLEKHFAGFFDGTALASKENLRGAYYVCDSKGQWYGFGDNYGGRIAEETVTTIHRFEKKEYTIRYNSAMHDSIGRYGNYSRSLPIDEIKETSAYRKFAKMYGEKNLDVYFSYDSNLDFITQLEQGETSGWDGPDVSRKIECEVSILLKNAYIFDPVPVDGEGLVPSKSVYGPEPGFPSKMNNEEKTIEYYIRSLFGGQKGVQFDLDGDQQLYLNKLNDRGYAVSRKFLMEDVVSIYREDKILYIITVNDIQQYDIDKLARGEMNAIWSYK